ncbi:EAL domain-containing protein [Roseibium sp.]|uniref:sensor domain-containing protein n=1 Tax=Roseibium sp. TaxID=1936156 RepID=UPI003BAF1935
MQIEALKSSFLDLTNDPVAIARLAPGETTARLIYVNAAFTDAFGYALEDVSGDTLNRLHAGDDWFWHSFEDGVPPSGRDRRQDGTCRLVRADGTSVDTGFSYFLVDADKDENEQGGRYFCATYRPRSGVTDAERAYARLVAALNAYPDPIVVYDRDLKMIFCNDGYAASMSDKPEELVAGMHLEEVLRLAVRDGRYPDAIGREDAWIQSILSPEFLESAFEDVELDGDVHHRLLRSRSTFGDYVIVRLNSTELVRQKRQAEAAQARLIAALNAYPAPFVIYDSDDCLVVCNDAYRASMSENPEDLKVGMHRTDVARVAIRAGKIANAVGREEEWMSDQHQDAEMEKPVQDLELPGDVHHRLLRSRVENGDLVILRIDTTELVRQRRAFESAQDRLISAIHAYPDPFAIYDADLKLVVWNPAYEEAMSGESGKLTAGTSLKDVLYTAALSGRIPAAVGCEEEWAERYYSSPHLTAPGVEDLELADDQYHRVVRSRTEAGEFVILRLNITEVVRQRRALEEKSVQLEKANRDITYMALHDDLTGLGNRRYLAQKFDLLVQKRRENGGEIAALHIDLDRFKNINDTMGHAAGDEVLLEISRRIRTHVDPGDVVARIGGDEFVVLLSVTGNSDRPETLARDLLSDLSRPLFFEGKECRFGATVGLARTPLAEVEQLLTTSDLALYKAKRRGRGQLGIFDRADLEDAQRTKALADDVLRGIEAVEFEPYFQPQMDAATGEVVALEALARWRHPEYGILAPGAFLSIATDLNVAGDIDRLIFEQAIAACQSAFGSDARPPSLSFNVSEGRINHHDFDAIQRQVQAYAGQVSFELLETIFLEEQDDASLCRLDRLRELGIAIEVDDFGSGRASVVALQRINPDRLKIDRRLVALVDKGSGGLRLLRSLIEIGHALEIGVTAEGVETRDQADILAGLGCDRLQGYHFARPMAFADLVAFLRKSEDARSEQVFQPDRRLPPMF